MLQNHKRWGVVLGLLAVALLAACSKDAVSPDRSTPAGPGFKEHPSCTPGKWTGGGRIDPSIGKFTFGFNVFLGSDCSVTKGEIEVNGHPFKIAWHVSIHNNGFDDFGTNE